jgi:hypothetical protein
MDSEIRIENPIGRLIAAVSSFEIKVFQALTPEELKEVAWVTENFNRIINNLIEE